jgi:hypothetical protein
MDRRVPPRYDFNRSAALAFVLIASVLAVGALAIGIAAMR